MPLINLISLPFDAPSDASKIERADIVLNIARIENGVWKKTRFAHVGLAAQKTSGFRSDGRINVFHMTTLIVREEWFGDVVRENASRVDLIGTKNDVDESIRADIINIALSYYQNPPSILHDRLECYWMGKSYPHSHPLFPHVSDVYGFSCATFAHYCYEQALPQNDSWLVKLDKMPVTSSSELSELTSIFKSHVEKQSFRRLYPSYLAGAFEMDEYPFEPDDWEPWKDHGRFIPTQP